MMDGMARLSADSHRDALAILAAAIRDDDEGISAVLAGASVTGVIGIFAGMVLGLVRESGSDPAQWVEAEQARALAGLGAG
jgi:hypothetical protein